MSKLTKSYKSNFTTVPNNIINDNLISLKAKGLYLFLISKPDNWHFSVDRIAAQNSDGENSVRTALKELETLRYLKRVQINKRGVFGENDYIVYDEPYPSDENRLTVDNSNPSDDSRRSVSRRSENRCTLVKTNLVIEERENINTLPEIIEPQIFDTSLPVLVTEKYPLCFEFVDECLKTTRRVHSPAAFKSSLYAALYDVNHKRHEQTIFAYYDFVERKNSFDVSTLPENTNYFDYIAALHDGGVL